MTNQPQMNVDKSRTANGHEGEGGSENDSIPAIFSRSLCPLGLFVLARLLCPTNFRYAGLNQSSSA